MLRAYECGSDHHLADSTGYLLLRAVLASVARRALQDGRGRHLHVGDIHIDLAARQVNVAGNPVRLSGLEFELLAKFASEPIRVFSKHELGHCIWHHQQTNGRTVDGTSRGCAPASPRPAPTRCSSTNGAQGWSLRVRR